MKNEIRLSDKCFSQLMNLVMCSDPWPCPDEGNQKEIVDLLTIESQLRGYQDWIEAYHKFNPDKVTDEFMDKVTYE